NLRPKILTAFLAALVVALPVAGQTPEIPPYHRSAPIGEPPPVPGPEGEVQGRGPVHEGFAQPGNGAGQPGPLAPQQPPEPIPYLQAPPESIDRGPSVPAPEVGSSYVPGIWLFEDGRCLWRPGFWSAPRPGFVYTPPRYVWTPRGYVYVAGFWDRPFASRGIL